ncbi:restriction endonuclease subunit S [Pseudoalteromonas sp. TB5-MNA-CIBAN-0075]|uniref:restriction endonuclease subunit S n=5 Tax=Pseudoalteromonas TaxID=53246 RepID=UPI00332ADB03
MTQQEVMKPPKGWELLNIGDISTIQNGFAFKSGWFTDSGKFQVIKLGNVKDDYLKLEKSPAFVSLDIANEYMKYKPDVGDILISMTGTKYKGDYGYVCRVNEDLSILINQRVGRIIAKSELIEGEFLHHYMRSEFFRVEFFKGETGGVNQGNVGTKHIQSCSIGIPPLPEQKRIVEKLDSLLAQVDTIQQRLNNLPDIIKRFRQSVLAAAVSGKLTEQWRMVNEILKPTEVLNNLLHARKEKWEEEQLKSFQRKGKLPTNDKWKNKYKSPQEGYLDEYDTTIIKSVTKDWLVSNLDSVSVMVTGKTPSTTDDTNWDGDIPFISPSQITKEGCVTAPSRYVSTIGAAKTPILPKNSVLVVCIGTIGKVGLLDKDAAFNQQINAMIPVNGMNKMFLFYWSKTLHDWLNKTSSAVVNAAIINKSRLSIAPCPVPSIEEQTEIVRLVEQYFALADTLEKNLANAKQRVDNLTQSILAKAFRGELVPQDPNDEPADKLLARIKAARLEAEKLEKAAKKAAKASKK